MTLYEPQPDEYALLASYLLLINRGSGHGGESASLAGLNDEATMEALVGAVGPGVIGKIAFEYIARTRARPDLYKVKIPAIDNEHKNITLVHQEGISELGSDAIIAGNSPEILGLDRPTPIIELPHPAGNKRLLVIETSRAHAAETLAASIDAHISVLVHHNAEALAVPKNATVVAIDSRSTLVRPKTKKVTRDKSGQISQIEYENGASEEGIFNNDGVLMQGTRRVNDSQYTGTFVNDNLVAGVHVHTDPTIGATFSDTFRWSKDGVRIGAEEVRSEKSSSWEALYLTEGIPDEDATKIAFVLEGSKTKAMIAASSNFAVGDVSYLKSRLQQAKGPDAYGGLMGYVSSDELKVVQEGFRARIANGGEGIK